MIGHPLSAVHEFDVAHSLPSTLAMGIGTSEMTICRGALEGKIRNILEAYVSGVHTGISIRRAYHYEHINPIVELLNRMVENFC